MRRTLREYEPFSLFYTGQPLFLPAQDLRICVREAELRLEALRDERNNLVRFHSDEGRLLGWMRKAERLVPLFHIGGHVSPRLGVRFEVKNGQLELYAPDGSRFLSYVELKRRMLAFHQSQLRRGGDRDFAPLEELMLWQCRARGAQAGVAAAEAFRSHPAWKRVRAW